MSIVSTRSSGDFRNPVDPFAFPALPLDIESVEAFRAAIERPPPAAAGDVKDLEEITQRGETVGKVRARRRPL